MSKYHNNIFVAWLPKKNVGTVGPPVVFKLEFHNFNAFFWSSSSWLRYLSDPKLVMAAVPFGELVTTAVPLRMAFAQFVPSVPIWTFLGE